ncbi:MAG TPA: glutathione S-transferase [Thermoanaerobaculia bacterium]|nr:glutathione S-transferase [Thermoanaerobaculia bacterium]
MPSPPRLTLVIANKNYSSWSLRAWFALRCADVAFAERRIPLFTDQWHREIGAHSPSRRAPSLLVESNGAEPLRIWDSLAICEYAAETWPERRLWPSDPAARAVARAVSAEMHSGFLALRAALPMNCRASGRRVEITDAVRDDIRRVSEIWAWCRERATGGPWLFGELSIADAMYLPVASRFATYGVELAGGAADYAAALLDHPVYRGWRNDAETESEIVEEDEAGA